MRYQIRTLALICCLLLSSPAAAEVKGQVPLCSEFDPVLQLTSEECFGDKCEPAGSIKGRMIHNDGFTSCLWNCTTDDSGEVPPEDGDWWDCTEEEAMEELLAFFGITPSRLCKGHDACDEGESCLPDLSTLDIRPTKAGTVEIFDQGIPGCEYEEEECVKCQFTVPGGNIIPVTARFSVTECNCEEDDDDDANRD